MSQLQAKYQLMVDQGWTPALELPFVEVPVGDGEGTWFTWGTTFGGNIAVYQHPSVGAFEVHGAILEAYLTQGGPLGALGYPVSDEMEDPAQDPPGGRVSEFQHGSIFWSRATGKTTVMITGPVTEGAEVRFRRLATSGTGLTGRPLGDLTSLTFFQNGVEVQFTVDSGVHQRYRNLRPVQETGPEAIWVRSGHPLQAAWELHGHDDTARPDGPDPANVHVSSDSVAYFDDPGPNVAMFLVPRRSRLWVVQNFSGWVEGEPLDGGAPQRLCPPVKWHSRMNLVDQNWESPLSIPNWGRFEGSGASWGWVGTSAPPA